jgi:cytoskeletal protein CcmA (bactofilin family)
MTRRGRRWLLPLAAFALIILLALTASAALGTDRLGGKARFGDTITVPSSETVDHDLYIFAGQITVNGNVKGDLVALGGQIAINGSVSGELVVAGGNVNITGPVGGNIRGSGGQFTVNGTVGKDVAVASGNLSVTGKVGGDLLFAAGQADVPGSVTGSIEGGAGRYTREGTVGGTEEVSIGQGFQAPAAPAPAGNAVLDVIRQFVVVFLLGALALWLFPRAVHATEETLRVRTLQSFVSGLLTCIGYVVAVIVVFIVLIVLAIVFGLLTLGALAAIESIAGILFLIVLTFAFIVAVAFLADALVGLALGRWIAGAFNMRVSADRWSELGLLALGAAVVAILAAIPVVGWIVKLAVVLGGLGALVLAAWTMWQSRRRPTAPPAWQSAPAAPEPPAAPPPTEPPAAPPTEPTG